MGILASLVRAAVAVVIVIVGIQVMLSYGVLDIGNGKVTVTIAEKDIVLSVEKLDKYWSAIQSSEEFDENEINKTLNDINTSAVFEGGGDSEPESNGTNSVGNEQVTDGKWHHVAARLNGSTVNDIELVVDESPDPISQVNDGGGANQIQTKNTTDVHIGRKSVKNVAYWDGRIDDLRVYNRSPSNSEIKQIYDRTKP